MTTNGIGNNGEGGTGEGAARVTLRARPERRLIRPTGSKRHVEFAISVGATAPVRRERPPLNLSLVLDRSGSMQGDKLTTAKRAALSVIEQLGEEDRAAVIVFDSTVDVVQAAERVTPMV